jgi:N utilization substance protein B
MRTRRRTRAREIALQALYQHDVAAATETPIRTPEELEAFLREESDDPEVVEYARSLVRGTLALQSELDRRIVEVAEHWKLHRIAAVDRSILRLALYELLEAPDVPPKVAIDEAIELAKKFSTAQSGGFVNGILDRAYRNLVAEFGDGGEPADVPRPASAGEGSSGSGRA